VWPATFSLAKAYTDQLQRSNGLSPDRLASVRQGLASAEGATGTTRRETLNTLARDLTSAAGGSSDGAKVRTLANTVRELAAAR
jgi:hypothetical protein